MVSSIPIENIYYLLSYAWNKLDEAERKKISRSSYTQPLDLLARIYISAGQNLLKKGIEKHYRTIEEEYAGLKGKIDFCQSLKMNLFHKGRAHCAFDEFSENIPSNQLVKAIFRRLLQTKDLNVSLKQEAKACFQRMGAIDNITITKDLFQSIRIHQNNNSYGLILQIGKLIFEQTAIEQSTGKYLFKDFSRDHRKMASLFEAFAKNFYEKEQKEFKVTREDIKWNIDEELSTGNRSLLPKMQTDISLTSKSRKIIIDTKFYPQALVSRYDKEKLHSAHLYQLYSYLRNLEESEKSVDPTPNTTCEGILLYPDNGKELNEQYTMGKHKIRIATINLDTKWLKIHERLLNLIK